MRNFIILHCGMLKILAVMVVKIVENLRSIIGSNLLKKEYIILVNYGYRRLRKL